MALRVNGAHTFDESAVRRRMGSDASQRRFVVVCGIDRDMPVSRSGWLDRAMAALAESPEAHACYSRQLGEYALGRDLGESDRALVNELTTASMSATGSVKAMLLAAVRSPRFLTRNGGAL